MKIRKDGNGDVYKKDTEIFSGMKNKDLWQYFACFLEIEIVVPESHLICDMRFYAEIGVPPPTLDAGVPAWDVVVDEWRLYIYISKCGRKIRTYSNRRLQNFRFSIFDWAETEMSIIYVQVYQSLDEGLQIDFRVEISEGDCIIPG